MTAQERDSSLLESLKNKAGQKSLQSFRDHSKLVGSVYTIDYSEAVVTIFDHDRDEAGGISKGMFLLAAKQEGNGPLTLLRVQRPASLPSASNNDETREKSIEQSANSGPWAANLSDWMRDKISLHALQCSVLGSFTFDNEQGHLYSEDIDNYYAVNELMVWKPDHDTLDIIVNHRHRRNDIPIQTTPKTIGKTKFAASERPDAVKAEFLLNPTDMLKRRTAYFGMSRSGKSNGLKVMAEAVYRLREGDDTKNRIGQLIFDPNGEYAQDNLQDGIGLHRIHEVLGLNRSEEVETYGLLPVHWDPNRKIMKLNFYGNPIPSKWTTTGAEIALEQLTHGRTIIKNIMASESSIYTKSFRDADISVPQHAEGNPGIQTRFRRAILAYQTALAAAGLELPKWAPSIRGLFGKSIINALKHHEGNSQSANMRDYRNAAGILETAKRNNHQITWAQLQIVFTALNKFINSDPNSHYKQFNSEYTTKPNASGDSWADSRLESIIKIFEHMNGPRSFQIAREQHSPNIPKDFADAIVDDLKKGKLVIIDQSAGEIEQNQDAAERVMWSVYHAQQEAFKQAFTSNDAAQLDSTEGHILAYIEEAHNLLPRANDRNNLSSVWAKAAKEGSKLNLGMVLSTQAPSSVMPEILSETDNWIIAYLNSKRERRVVSDYMDFADFEDQIGKVSEQGYVRIRMLSQAYTVPVKLKKFKLDESPKPLSLNNLSPKHNELNNTQPQNG